MTQYASMTPDEKQTYRLIQEALSHTDELIDIMQALREIGSFGLDPVQGNMHLKDARGNVTYLKFALMDAREQI